MGGCKNIMELHHPNQGDIEENKKTDTLWEICSKEASGRNCLERNNSLSSGNVFSEKNDLSWEYYLQEMEKSGLCAYVFVFLIWDSKCN